MSWVWVDHWVKRSERGWAEPPCISKFVEFALKIVVFDSTNNYLLSSKKKKKSNRKYRICHFSILCTIFVAKSHFTDQSHYLHFGVILFPVTKSYEICCFKFFGNHAQIIAILTHYVSPGYRIFKEVDCTPHYIVKWFEVKKICCCKIVPNFDKPCKMCLPYFFLLFFLWSNVSIEQLQCLSKVIKVVAWIFRQSV